MYFNETCNNYLLPHDTDDISLPGVTVIMSHCPGCEIEHILTKVAKGEERERGEKRRGGEVRLPHSKFMDPPLQHLLHC